MAWTAPRTWTPGEVVSASILNTHLRDNLLYDHSGHQLGGQNLRVAAWSTTGTSYADIDATYLSATVNVTTGMLAVYIGGYLLANNTGGVETGQITLLLDGVDQGDATYGITRLKQNFFTQLSQLWIFTGLSVGNHTVKLQWKVSAGTLTLNLGENDASRVLNTTFRAWEFSG